MAVTSYDPQKVTLNINGVQISGYADGTFIEAAPAEARSSTKVSADGTQVTRIKSRNRSGSITITLMDGSESNSFLAALDTLDDQGVNVVFSVSVEDGVNTEIFGSVGWIEEAPTRTYGKEPGTSQWKIGVDRLNMIVKAGSAGALAVVAMASQLIDEIL